MEKNSDFKELNLRVNDVKYNLLMDSKFKNRTICSQPYKQFINHKFPILNKHDRRSKVNNTDEYPYSTIGILTFEDDYGEYWGTGTLISENIVLTCAHNLFDKKTKKEYYNFVFSVQMNDGRAYPHFRSKVIKSYFPIEEYLKDDGEDYAILFLEKNIGQYSGFMGIAFDYNLEENKDYYLFGFPGSNEGELYGMKTNYQNNSQNIYIVKDMIRYKDIDTEAGQTGSGLWFKEEYNKHFIFGIHVRGCNDYNEAIYITKERFEKIKGYITESNIDTSILVSILDLSKLSIDIGSMIFLSKCNQINNIKQLILQNCNINDDTIRLLKNCKFVILKKLFLGNNKIGDTGIKSLIDCIQLTKLDTLDLSSNNIKDGIKYLIDCKHFETLEKLYLGWNNIGDGVRYLIDCKHLDRIETLDLKSNNIGEKEVKYLIECRQFDKLDIIDLRYNNIEEKALKELRSKFPYAYIDHI